MKRTGQLALNKREKVKIHNTKVCLYKSWTKELNLKALQKCPDIIVWTKESGQNSLDISPDKESGQENPGKGVRTKNRTKK